jgi:hypothetical protein
MNRCQKVAIAARKVEKKKKKTGAEKYRRISAERKRKR